MQLDTPDTGTKNPAVQFHKIGDHVIVGIVDVKDYQQRDFESGDLLFWDDDHKEPKMGKLVTGLVINGDGATIKTDDVQRPVHPGDIVSFWCEGSKHFTWRDAVKATRTGVMLGDVMLWTFTAEEPSKKRGFNARKVYEAKIRRPEPRDGDIVDRCQAARNENRQQLDTPSVAPEDPF